MAITNVGSASQTTVISTDHSLNVETVFGIYQAYVNLTNLAKGDVIRVFVTTKVLTGDTEEIIFEAIYSNDLGSSSIVCTPPWVSEFSSTLHIQQTVGSARAVPWAVYRLDS